MKRLVKNSIWGQISLVGLLLSGFITTPLLLRILGTSQYGLLAILVATVYPVGGVATLNLGRATTKYVAEAHGRADLKLVSNYIQTTLAFNIIVGLIVTLALMLLSHWL